jgi:hypothetical protein
MFQDTSAYARRFSPLLIAAICTLARPAQAQEVGRGQELGTLRSMDGIFGGDSAPAEQLSVSWSVLGAADRNLTSVSSGPTADDPLQAVGTYGTTEGSLTYRKRGKHSVFSTSAATGGRYYPDYQEFSRFDGVGGVSYSADVGGKTAIRVAQGISYQPYYELNFVNIPGQTTSSVATRDTNALSNRASTRLIGNFGLTQRFTRRSSLTADYSYRRTQFSGDPEQFFWQIAHVMYSHNVSRYAALRLGYGRGEGRDGVGVISSTVNHDIDAGVDYSRALSFSRKTTLGFTSGATVIQTPGALGDRQSYFRWNGTASLTREMGRTWSADATYRRGIQFLEGLADPLYADTIQFHVGGLLNRRFELGLWGDYSRGTLGVPALHQEYSTYTGGSDLRMALNRTLAAYVQYFAYHYGFENNVQLSNGVSSTLARQGVRFGISGWLPLYRAKESGN